MDNECSAGADTQAQTRRARQASSSVPRTDINIDRRLNRHNRHKTSSFGNPDTRRDSDNSIKRNTLSTAHVHPTPPTQHKHARRHRTCIGAHTGRARGRADTRIGAPGPAARHTHNLEV